MTRKLALLAIAPMLAGLGIATPAPAAQPEADDEGWKKTLDFDFSEPDAVKDWILEGAAEVAVADGRLRIRTVEKEIEGKPSKKSQLWYPKPLEGDVRFVFDARSDGQDGSILIFNAQALPPHKSIFEFPRPQATNDDFTTNPYMRDYTLGYLRHWQDTIRLRYNGGERAELFANIFKAEGDARKEAWRKYDEGSILAAFPTPYKEVDKTYRIDVRVTGPRIRVFVDGKKVCDVVDEWHKDAPVQGGWFALRNWRPGTTVEFDRLTVYTK